MELTDKSHNLYIYIYPIDNNHILWTLLRITTFWIVLADNSHILWTLLIMATFFIEVTNNSHILWPCLTSPPFYMHPTDNSHIMCNWMTSNSVFDPNDSIHMLWNCLKISAYLWLETINLIQIVPIQGVIAPVVM